MGQRRLRFSAALLELLLLISGTSRAGSSIRARATPATATPQGGTWHRAVERVDLPKMSRDMGTRSLALDANGHPHISYYDYTNKDLKYARCTQAVPVLSAAHREMR